MYAAREFPRLRQIVRTVAAVRLHKVGRGTAPGGGAVPARFRVSVRPLMPAPGEWIMPADFEPIRAEARQRLAERKAEGYISADLRDRLADALRAGPMLSDKAINRMTGCNFATATKRVRRELEAAGEVPVIRRKGRATPVNHGYLVRRLPVGDSAAPAGARAST
jgi:hypothetical protein